MNRNKKIPMRRCAGCGASKPKRELLRIAMSDGGLHPDPSGRGGGRGAYLCRDSIKECLELAKKKRAFPRTLRAEISEEALTQLEKELADYEG